MCTCSVRQQMQGGAGWSTQSTLIKSQQHGSERVAPSGQAASYRQEDEDIQLLHRQSSHNLSQHIYIRKCIVTDTFCRATNSRHSLNLQEYWANT